MPIRAAIATVLLLTFSGPGLCQTSMTFNKRAVASDTFRQRADTLRSSTAPQAVVIKEFFVLYAGTVRLKWQYRSASGALVQTVAKIASEGSEFSFKVTSSTTFAPVICDVPITAGERLQIVVRPDSGAVEVRNARIFFDLIEVNKPAVSLID